MHIHETKWIGMNMDHKWKFTYMDDLEVETHVWCYDVSGMAMMLVYGISVVYGMVMMLKIWWEP